MANVFEDILRKRQRSPEVPEEFSGSDAFLSQLLRQAPPLEYALPSNPTGSLAELRANPLDLDPSMGLLSPEAAARNNVADIQDEAADLNAVNAAQPNEILPDLSLENDTPPPPQASAPVEDELTSAQRRASDLSSLLMMAKGAEKIGTSLARVKSDPTYLDDMKGMINRPVEDVMNRQKYKAARLEGSMKEADYAAAKELDQPDSNVSKLYRETARSMIAQSPTLQKNEKLTEVLAGDISAAELQKFSPMLFNLVSQEQARQAKVEALHDAAAVKKEKADDEDNKDKKKFTRDLRRELTQGSFGTLYKNASVAQRSNATIEQFMKNPTGYSDYATLMGGLKTLQGDESVVREAEIRLGMQAGSFKDKVFNDIDRLRTGKSLQPKQREAILKSVQILGDVATRQYQEAVQPILQQADAEGIDHKLILPGNLFKPQKQEAAGDEVERQTKDGRVAIFDAKTKKFLKYKDK